MVVRAGWVIDGSGGPIQRDVCIRVEKGRIVSMSTFRGEASTSIHDDLHVDDHRNCTIIPGLVDSHVHLFMSGTQDPERRERQLHQPYDACKKIIRHHLSEHLSHGILAVRDGGDHGGYSLRYKSERLHRGALPIIRSPGTAWRAPGRYGALIGFPPPKGCSLAEAVAHSLEKQYHQAVQSRSISLHEHRPVTADHVKIVNSGLNSLVRYGKETSPQFELHSLLEAARVCRKSNLRIMVHANGCRPVALALESGCDSIEHGFFMGRDNLERMAENRIAWVPTACTMQAYAELLSDVPQRSSIARRNLEHQLAQIGLARDLGVVLVAGTDAGSPGVHHGRALRMEIGLLMQAGLSLVAAIRCATYNAATLLGLEMDLGILEPGMPATFLAVKTSPDHLPEEMHRLEAIYLNGQPVPLPMASEGGGGSRP